MSYPKRLHIFKKWAKAMEEGATVDSPHYHGTKKGPMTRRPFRKRKKRLKRRRRKRTQDA